MRFVFIVGVARTGSKIYMNILNQHTNINISSEMHYLSPKWIRKDFVTTAICPYFGMDKKKKIKNIVEMMYSGTLRGTFWNLHKDKSSGTLENCISDINHNMLLEKIFQSNATAREIFRIIIEEHARSCSKEVPGAKFPMDISMLPTLIKWFPDSKIIHIIRDPRAIYASMKMGDLRYSQKKARIILFTIIRRFIYAIHQYRISLKMHRRFLERSNYLLMKYEDVLLDPEANIKKLCDFLGIEFKARMLFPPIVDSSYGEVSAKKGFDRTRIDKWKHSISPLSAYLIKSILSAEMKTIGYK